MLEYAKAKQSQHYWIGMLAALFCLVMGAIQPVLAQPVLERDNSTQAVAAGSAAGTKLPLLIPARHFAERSPFQSPQLSPNGDRISFLRDIGGQNEIALADPVTGQSFRSVLIPDGPTIINYQWISNDAIFIRALVRFRDKNRLYTGARALYVASASTGQVIKLVADPFLAHDAVPIWFDDAGRTALIAHPNKKDVDYPSVYQYDLQSGQMVGRVQQMITGITSWKADTAGTLRLGIGWHKGRQKVWYRSNAAAEMTQIADLPRGDLRALNGIAQIKAGSDQGVVMKRAKAGAPIGLHRYDFAQKRVTDTLYQHPQWDIDRILSQEDNIAGVGFTDSSRRIVWLDADMKAVTAQLKSALGGSGTAVIVQARSKDSQRMLIRAGNAADPGVLYFFDRAKSNMAELAQYRPKLDFRALAQPRPISYQARDGTKIHGYLTLPKGREPKKLALIIMPHGGPYGVRDTLTYNDRVQFLANRGYAVIQPNYRGSGGYGKAFYDLGIGEVGRGMQDDIDDAMDWAVNKGLADPKRVCVVGGSYGGYAAMWAVLRNPERYVCAASWAGVSDWTSQLRQEARFLTRYDKNRFRERVEGANNFNLASVSPTRFASRLNRPLLLVHGTRDGIVPFSQFEKMVEASKDAPIPPTAVTVPAGRHSFRNERDQQEWFDALDSFLAKHNPADQLDAAGKLRVAPDDELDSMFKPLVIEKPVQN
ncbi:MAG: alpha/beta fold hydrolase [Erythrobacter sp.]